MSGVYDEIRDRYFLAYAGAAVWPATGVAGSADIESVFGKTVVLWFGPNNNPNGIGTISN